MWRIRQRHSGKRPNQVIRTRWFDAKRIANDSSSSHRERMISPHHFRPAAGQQRADALNRCRHAEIGGRIKRAGPAKLDEKPRAIRARRVRAVTDNKRSNQFLPVPLNVKKCRAFGRAKPLVAVARVISRAKFFQVYRQHTGGVRAVNERLDSAPGQFAHQPFDRNNQTGWACDVINQCEPSARSHTL